MISINKQKFLFVVVLPRRILQSTEAEVTHEKELVEWERCDFEEDHCPVAWLVFYVSCTVIIFVGKFIICLITIEKILFFLGGVSW